MVAETMVGGPSTWPGRPLARSRVRAVHAFGGPVSELVDASMTADLVILGTRGRGRTRSALIGSVSCAVAARAYSPVVVLHDLGHSAPGARRDVPVPGPEREVICALTPGTGDAHANRIERIVSVAAKIAAACAALLRLVTVLPQMAAGPADSADLQASPYAVATLALAHPDMTVATQTLYGDPVEALAGTSRESGLLVIGAPHRGGVGAVLAGTPAYRIIHDATCPVMLVQ
jgi:nucleotide-binding universal stress UspA family protein